MDNNKKTRKRIPQENKVRALLQQEVRSSCPFCENKDVGHFQIHHIDEDPSNNELINLILLCPNCHSKITKGDISINNVYKMKLSLLHDGRSLPGKDNFQGVTNINNKGVQNNVLGSNNIVTINNTKKTTRQNKYPEGCIGHDLDKANYISYLITRYHDYKKYEVGKGKMNYSIFNVHLKKRFKLGASRTIYNLSIDKFEELSYYIQSRIDATKLAKVKRGEKNYSSFQEYINK